MTVRRVPLYTIISFVVVFIFAFSLSSGLFSKAATPTLDKLWKLTHKIFREHSNSLIAYPNAHHYFLFTREFEYLKIYRQDLSPQLIFNAVINALVNVLLQPMFLCIFTPQTILNFILFPFFLYGIIRYFKKLPVMILFLFIFSAFIGMRDAIVEALVRHRMVCDQIYLLIGIAGLKGWITER